MNDETKIIRDVRKDERRKIAIEIIEKFSGGAPLPTKEFNALREFTKGSNARDEDFIDFAWEIGAREYD